MFISLERNRNYYHSFDTLTRSDLVGLVLVRNDLEALADDEEDHDKQENWTMCISLEKKRSFCHSFETLAHSVWVGLVLDRIDLEALADDEEDHK